MIPFQMDIERIVLKEMIEHDDSFKAIRAIPISLRRFYVQAYQSFIFNQSLSLAFSDGENLFEANSGDVCFDFKGIIGKFRITKIGTIFKNRVKSMIVDHNNALINLKNKGYFHNF